MIGDILDFALNSKEWEGPFGFVTFRLHKAVHDGSVLYFIRSDASDEGFAREEQLIFVPKLQKLAKNGPTGELFLFRDGVTDQATILSSEPGRSDYTPAWKIRHVSWKDQPKKLSSLAELDAAERSGKVNIHRTNIVLNAPVVKWSKSEMPADNELKQYLGPGQLVERADTGGLKVTFKLHECFPQVRYIVVDTSLAPMAEGMKVAHSPALLAARTVKATGRTNVFMNGIEGPGPMGFQPSVFDSQVGEPEWSPYWDHLTYAWKKSATPRVLITEKEVHRARDAGELKEFPGTPDTKGEIFTVNCPVAVLAPNTFIG